MDISEADMCITQRDRERWNIERDRDRQSDNVFHQPHNKRQQQLLQKQPKASTITRWRWRWRRIYCRWTKGNV